MLGARNRRMIRALFVAATLFFWSGVASAQVTQSSGKVDGHYYKWIFDGPRFKVCTNISKEKGEYLSAYLEWAYSAMAAQFDTANRSLYLKKWEVNFEHWKQGPPAKTRTGNQVIYDLKGGARVWQDQGNGWHYIELPNKQEYSWHERTLEKNRLIVHYVADEKEDRLVRNAFKSQLDLGSEYGRAFFMDRFGVLLVDKTYKTFTFDKTVDTAVHEACHYMFSFSSFVQPVWFNEGYCYYLYVDPEYNLAAGTPRFDFLKRIREAREKRTYIPISKLITFTHEDFRKSPDHESLSYAESWALFSYLNSEASGFRNQFYTWYNRMRNGEDPTKTFHTVFNVSDLERKLLAWCDFQLNQLLNSYADVWDSNKDGTPDYYDVYEGGYLKYTIRDTTGNNQIDFWRENWPNGNPKTKAWDEDGNGQPEFWNYCDESGKCNKVGTDTNGDGQADKFGQPSG